MSDKLIQGCEVRFQFQCPKQWDALRETPEAGVRSCSQCQKHVYLCRDTSEVARHAQAGHCIAVPAWVTSPKDVPDDPERLQALARQHGVPSVDLRDFTWTPALRRMVPREVARKHLLLPLRVKGTSLVVASSDPANLQAIDDVKFFSGYTVEVVVASRRDIEEILDQADREDSVEVLMGVVDWEPEA